MAFLVALLPIHASVGVVGIIPLSGKSDCLKLRSPQRSKTRATRPLMASPVTCTDGGSPTSAARPHQAVSPEGALQSSSVRRMPADDPPASVGPGPGWLALMLDEVGYGMVLLDDQAQLLFANHAACAECESGHPLQLRGHQLLAAQPEHAAMPPCCRRRWPARSAAAASC